MSHLMNFPIVTFLEMTLKLTIFNLRVLRLSQPLPARSLENNQKG